MTLMRPKCVNHGCDKHAHSIRRHKNGSQRWRPLCSHCHEHRNDPSKLRPGVTPYKTGECSNKNGRLGFKCITIMVWAVINLTEIDHIDGNHRNHAHDNLQELCPFCHKIKSEMNNDNKSHKYAGGTATLES